MNNNSLSPPCICYGESYKKACPYTFEQGGSKFHCIGGDVKALPFEDDCASIDSWEEDTCTTGIDGLLDALRGPSTSSHIPPPPPPPSTQMERELKTKPHAFEQIENLRSKSIKQARPTELANTPAIYMQCNKEGMRKDTAESLMEDNRNSLKRFEALKINGKSLNDYSIAGFKLDIEQTKKIVQQVAPLPPSALPKIFTDDDLNFYHHFFKGIESLLGTGTFLEVVNARYHYEKHTNMLPEAIIGFMESGLDSGDNALTLLVKKVLSSTFRKSIIKQADKELIVLEVMANLWGFRYIEPGMILKDADIKMWLSNCYLHYRTLWFDTFKSSGIPEFANEGVILNHSNPVLSVRRVLKQNQDAGQSLTVYKSRSNRHNDGEDQKRRPTQQRRSNSWFN